MKKLLRIALAGLLLTSCGAHHPENRSSSDNPSQTTAPSDTPGEGSDQDNNQDNPKNKNDMKTIHLTKADFLKKVVDFENNSKEWKYLGDKPCLVDFYASWCGPCKALSPILDELAAEYGDQIYIYKINTEEEQELAAAFGIRSIPTLIFVPLQGEPTMAQGALPKSELKKAIDQILLGKQ